MTTYTGTLDAGQQLNVGDTLTSPSNTYQLVLQKDGNLVINKLSDHSVIWKTGFAANQISPKYAIIQTDGDFVLYDNNNKSQWSALTRSVQDSGGVLYRDLYIGVTLSLRDDGVLVIQHSSPNADGFEELWNNLNQLLVPYDSLDKITAADTKPSYPYLSGRGK